jgi:hypothetical protein
VIEHVEDSFAFLAEMEARADTVLVNLLESAPDDPEVHHELPIEAILERASDLGLRSYGIHHGRSHLVAYRPAPSGAAARLINRARIRAHAGRHRVGARARAAAGLLRR